MRHLLFFLSLSVASSSAFAVPVFLRPESRFATGNQPRSKLETHTRKTQQQRWFHVKTKDHAYGWIAEDHALTALRLVEQASLNDKVPVRTAPDLSTVYGALSLPKKSQVLILEIEGSWARVQPLGESEIPQSWVPTDKLSPVLSGGAQLAFVYQKSLLKVDASATAPTIMKVEEGTYVQIISNRGPWLEVRTGRDQGFLAKADCWTASDLGEKGIRAGIALAPLRAEPLPYADLIRTLSFSSTLTQTSSAVLKWGLASTREQGDVWWPMTDDVEQAREVAKIEKNAPTSIVTDKITTAELFARKIFDMATSHSVSSLKFVSADGIYRTMNGSTWTKIPIFGNQNYPIAVAKSGSIYIGPYVSDDMGETFQQWIRWDSLVSTLSKNPDVQTQNLKILEIHPEDAAGHRVSLRLNLGTGGDPIRVSTQDAGQNWKTF